MFSCPVWEKLYQEQKALPYMKELQDFVKQERATKEIFPSPENTFRALHLTPFAKISTVIIGQDPYHTPDVADGLAFSSGKEGFLPPSLNIILKEVIANMKLDGMKIDYDPLAVMKNFSLARWASEEGVLLLNPVLTVEKGRAGSHKNKGWENFTRQILIAVNDHPERLVIMLWGKEAHKHYGIFDYGEGSRHLILKAPHPAAELYNPLAGFTGFNCFYKERKFRQELMAKQESKQWPVNWLNIPNKSL